MFTRLTVALAVFGFYALLALAAFGRPPPGGGNGPLATWFQSLMQPSTGISCCSEADCRGVDWRVVGEHYEVYLLQAASDDLFGHLCVSTLQDYASEVYEAMVQQNAADGLAKKGPET